jgi:uncharacterized protein with von Willebrand factor type A (vWA) domain
MIAFYPSNKKSQKHEITHIKLISNSIEYNVLQLSYQLNYYEDANERKIFYRRTLPKTLEMYRETMRVTIYY